MQFSLARKLINGIALLLIISVSVSIYNHLHRRRLPSTSITPIMSLSPTEINPSQTPSSTPTPAIGKSPPLEIVSTHPLSTITSTPIVSFPNTHTPVPDPLRFEFPTPGPVPVSAWRPPLYPVPWALNPNDHFFFTRPIAADEVNWPLPIYRYGGVFFGDEVHTGIDIPADAGTSVIAAGAGKIVWAGYGLYSGLRDNKDDPYGLAIAIRHDFGYLGKRLFSVYAHMKTIDVELGQDVISGQMLGTVGATGHVTGPHLHFEVRLGSNRYFNTVNPELWIVPPQGWGVITGRVMTTYRNLLHETQISVVSKETGRVLWVNTYGSITINDDPFYKENVVLSDLPEGIYTIRIDYVGKIFSKEVRVFPGQVTYFQFFGRNGFSVQLPPIAGADYTPPANTHPANP